MKFFNGISVSNTILTAIKLLIIISVFGAFTITLANAQSLTSNVIAPICSIYFAVHTAIFILGLTLMILGGALYAGSHVMPGSSKGSIQGYGMGMILGGVIGVIIAIAAPYLLGLMTGNTNIISACGSVPSTTSTTTPTTTSTTTSTSTSTTSITGTTYTCGNVCGKSGGTCPPGEICTAGFEICGRGPGGIVLRLYSCT